MMAQAQKMMANMSPDDMQRMSQMAANMDPAVMENMMQNMGGGNMKVDAEQMKKGAEQMKNMTPDQLKAGMAQAQSQMGAQKQYMYNAAEMLKNEGNEAVKGEKYAEALTKYSKALENLGGHTGPEVKTLSIQLLNNSALCHLKRKHYDKAVEAADQALGIDPKSFKALFRRGQARAELGTLQEAVADVRQAAELSPSDKAIAAELSRLRGVLKEKGIEEDLRLNTQHEVSAAWASTGAGSSSGSRATSSSSRPATSGQGDEHWKQAAEKIAENPDMLKDATEAMSKLSPDELQAMMANAPLPPGMDPAMMKSQIEMLQKNPDMLRAATENLKSLPDEERKKLLQQRVNAGGGGGFPGGDPSAMSKLFENPDMMKNAVEMTKQMSKEDLKKLNINSPEEADMMRKAAEQMASNPDLTKQMSEMMKNMPPEQLEQMMNFSSRMRGGGAGGPGGPAGMPDMAGMDPSAMFNDPDMLKATEAMMKSMSPETLASMAKASGLDLSEDKAKMVARFLPWILKLMQLWGNIKKMRSAMFSQKGRLVLALVVVVVAVLQHYRNS